MTSFAMFAYTLAIAGSSSALADVQAQSAAPAAPATAGGTIEVGVAKWDKLPPLKAKERALDYSALSTSVERILESKQCTIPGQRPKSFDITVPFAVLVGPDGKASRVLVSDMGCAPLETLVGETAFTRSERGDFAPASSTKPRWYKSSLNIALQ